ncbi:MAG: flagellar biosynthesis protein FlhF [Blastocatellia bacterium]|jgi:flagellar biosynthesis protein FlhF|nr:flagellar biosynthesis protein FlhF [Blastocatellia bacterium]
MNVKRYRAATMRDALEQIKGELGDEALVLGSKEIRNKGFLGLGAKNFFEVRVSTELTESSPALSDRIESTPRKSNFTSLSLRDSTPALPAVSPARERSSVSMASALAARANSVESKLAMHANASISATRNVMQANSPAVETKAAAITPAATVLKTEEPAEINANPALMRNSLMVELGRLRAEIREVKFSLSRPSLQNRNDFAGTHSAEGFYASDSELYDSPFYEAYLHLASLGLPTEMCRAAITAVIATGNGSQDICELGRLGLAKALPAFIDFGEVATAADNTAGKNSVIALVGPTGVGKTTTIAKLAARVALRERRRVELITLDTYRIAAVDQLRTYAEIIGAGFHVPRSVLELDALIQRFAGDATVMIDTIGRSARDLADQLELADYLRANDEIAKYLVVQATTHPSDSMLAINRFALFGVNRLVITKLDETSRPGAAISTAAQSNLPLVYLCGGQRVPEDIENATAESLAAHALPSEAVALAA